MTETRMYRSSSPVSLHVAAGSRRKWVLMGAAWMIASAVAALVIGRVVHVRDARERPGERQYSTRGLLDDPCAPPDGPRPPRRASGTSTARTAAQFTIPRPRPPLG